jgi:hypothetical protein
VWQEDPEMAYEPSKIHKINYEGKYFNINASYQMHPSPQRTSLLFQAKSSQAGVAFGAQRCWKRCWTALLIFLLVGVLKLLSFPVNPIETLRSTADNYLS